jgi:cytochrome d ubiquinol oxidase subunit II
VRDLSPKLAGAFTVLGLLAVTMMFANDYAVVERFKDNPVWLLFPIAAVAAFGMIWFYRARGRDVAAFFSSSIMLGFLLISAGIGMYPNLLISTTNPAYNMTATNAASQQLTLEVMLVVAIVGLPFVILYTSGVQYLFRGKVELSPDSY